MKLAYALDPRRLVDARFRYRRFIDECRGADGLFRLTPKADSSSYALCFAIFGYKLLCAHDVIYSNRLAWNRYLRDELIAQKSIRERHNSLSMDKPYLQLLTFTLSALSIIDTLYDSPFADEVRALLPDDVESALSDAKALEGVPRSGNQAMFLAILLIYARDYLGCDTQSALDRWVTLHRLAMNQFGFWGSSQTPSHLQFQNGYHQYEILQFLQSEDISWEDAAASVAFLADDEGHFAPYPGGGGCYDYDAVFMLTTQRNLSLRYRELLMRTTVSILDEQNADGGFCESRYIRPRSLENLLRASNHGLSCRGQARLERFRFSLTLLRPKHDRIHTHWSSYSREWNESDLWDSWFRMLTLARIDCALNPEKVNLWGFIKFPGIGFNPVLHGKIAK
jgi:hypothetical protein